MPTNTSLKNRIRWIPAVLASKVWAPTLVASVAMLFATAVVYAASSEQTSARPTRVRHPSGSAGDPVSKAQPGDVRIIATGSIDASMEDVRDEIEQVVGHPVVIQYGSARGNLKKMILDGQNFEVAILLPDVAEELRAAGKVTAEQIDVGRVNIGIALRGDVPSMDVSTPEALKAAILGAKALEWNPTGVAIRTVDKILDTLQIRDRVAATYHLPRQPVPVALGPGEYELQIYPMSEILARGRARSLGPVIPALQVPQTMCAVVGANTPDRKSAEKIIAFLRGADTLTQAMAKNGISR